MAVDTTHPDYDAYMKEWKKCRDATLGQMAIHKGKQKYLPALHNQTTQEYKEYMERTLFYEATGRTVTALKGLIFDKPANVVPNGMEEEIENVTMGNMSLQDFARDVVNEVMQVGRVGLLVDYPSIDTSEMTAAQVRELRLQPFIKMYKAEDIINWRGDAGILTQVRLKENIEEQKDEFEYEAVEQIRVLELYEGQYRQRLFRKIKQANGKEAWIQISEVYPVMNGSRLDYIPFTILSPVSLAPDVKTPPILGLVNVNLSHYRTTASLEHGAHFTALPTAVITGHNKGEGEDEFRIGSTTAWIFSNPNANAKYLEFEGQGLQSLKDMQADKEEKMASLGAQMLTPESRRNEAAETAAMRHQGENSILSDISKTVSDALNIALEIMGNWLNVEPATIQLNTDFIPQAMSYNMLQSLMMAWQQGGISHQTLFENLKRGEVIDSQKEFDEEIDEIQNRPLVI